MKAVLKVVFCMGVVLLFLEQGYSGDSKGNGGGAWLCRNQDQSIRWIEQVDLFEARTEYYLSIQRNQDPISDQIETALGRAEVSSKNFVTQLRPYLDRVLKGWPSEGDSELSRIYDAYKKEHPLEKPEHRRIPDRRHCADGEIEYGQVVNYTNDGRILVNIDLYNQLSLTDQAALKVHEAVYALLRDKENVEDSERARKITGYLFSEESQASYSELLKIEEILKQEDLYNSDFCSKAALVGDLILQPGDRVEKLLQCDVAHWGLYNQGGFTVSRKVGETELNRRGFPAAGGKSNICLAKSTSRTGEEKLVFRGMISDGLEGSYTEDWIFWRDSSNSNSWVAKKNKNHYSNMKVSLEEGKIHLESIYSKNNVLTRIFGGYLFGFGYERSVIFDHDESSSVIQFHLIEGINSYTLEYELSCH